MALLTSALWGVLLIITAAFSHAAFCLARNYRAARRIGDVPIRIIPISHLNPIWMLIDRRVLALVKRLPMGLGNNSFTRFNWRGWEVPERWRPHEEMGDFFIVVTPGRNWVYTNNTEAVVELLRRSRDFPHDAQLTSMLDVFGPNISTSLDDNWRKQRRITASCFNDLNNEIVWAESLSQARDMLNSWLPRSSVETIADDTRTLSLHVMARAGFGQSFKFHGHGERLANVNDPAAVMSYGDLLQMILENCILIMALGPKFLAKPWLPHKLQTLHRACVAFQQHMTSVYEGAKRSLAEGGGRTSERNLMASLVRASQNDSDQSNSSGLTETEIYGNMFVFNFAGHDTTAHTFTFALYFLAANPDVQTWLSEEIRAVMGDRQPHEWSASSDFPRLKRCLSVLFETLRLYQPVPPAKWTGGGTQSLKVGNKTPVLPPQTMVIPSYAALHTDPKHWGEDSLTWRPQRWIATDPETGSEELISPTRGAFLGWSDGARDCPGRKFSQVEFVATMAALFKDARLYPVQRVEDGETLEAARERVLDHIERDTGYVLLIQILHPERCPLVWSERKSPNNQLSEYDGVDDG